MGFYFGELSFYTNFSLVRPKIERITEHSNSSYLGRHKLNAWFYIYFGSLLLHAAACTRCASIDCDDVLVCHLAICRILRAKSDFLWNERARAMSSVSATVQRWREKGQFNHGKNGVYGNSHRTQ